MSLYFLVINLDKNVDRYTVLSESLKSLNCNFMRVRAINGFDMDNDEDAKNLLFTRTNLLGNLFKSVDTKRKWVYDGSIQKSFPNLNLNGHYGTKGLTLSNIKCFEIACQLNYDWYCVLEDDSVMDAETLCKIQDFVRYPNNETYDIVLLDDRHNGWGGTCAMLYNKRIVNTLQYHLHPLSKFSILSSNYGDKNLGNLWDWKLWKYVMYINKKFTTLPCVKSGNFESTICV
jgi:hypothetical protein